MTRPRRRPITWLARAATIVLFRALPFVRRPWLAAMLRLYQWLFQYTNFVAGTYFGTSPKHLFDWGAQAFVVPRVRPGARVLDIGCGPGDLTWQVARVAASVVAYDRSYAAVAGAARRGNAGNVRFYCGDAEAALPVRGVFDVAILSSVLPFVDDPHALLVALRRICAEIIVRETRYDRDFTVPLMASMGMRHSTDPYARREYTRDRLMRELAEAGWTVKESLDTYDIYLLAVHAA